MSSEPLLIASELRKVFRVYNSPGARIMHLLSGKRWGSYREHLALDQVSFSLCPGDTLGILGDNGAGKTTLLALIAGLMKPTLGILRRPDRVGVLISLAAGFDHDATGRANLRQWGRMQNDGPFTSAEEQWIEDFTELGENLERPLRCYSQGMQLRLGFAVNCVRRPDLLVIDEVLAVGDIFFRQKCHARINAMVNQGTAAILVTHNPIEVSQFCQEALVLEQGRVLFQGTAQEAVSRYLAKRSTRTKHQGPIDPTRLHRETISCWPASVQPLPMTKCRTLGMNQARICRCALVDQDGRTSQIFSWGQTFRLLIELEAHQDLQVPVISWSLADQQGIVVTGSASHILETGDDWPEGLKAGSRWLVGFAITAQIRCDEYTLEIGVGDMALESYNMRQNMTPTELTGHVRVLGRIYAAACLAIIPDPRRVPAIIPHNGLAYLPCRVLDQTEKM